MKLELTYAPEVKAAFDDGRAVVALESTIITHGMPYPQNVETAKSVEATVRQAGAVPATIAVMNGTIHIGLSEDELEELATAKDVLKVSRADIAYAVSAKRYGATTVAATMICAAMAGIKTFATGGIGGVHRSAEQTYDVSADLREFTISPVTVVCAGAKAILDLPKTFEMLETLGVPVIGYQSDKLPAFWSRTSPIDTPIRMDAAADIASFVQAREMMGLQGGALVANPVPAEFEIPAEEINKTIDLVLKKADDDGISGKELTPYLLSAMFEATEGSSLKTNIELVKNNARLAAEIALAKAEG